MGICMKTTVDITDSLLAEAKKVAVEEGTTVRALIEEGLHEAIRRRKQRSPFRLREVSFEGRGLQQGLSEGDWSRIRELAYEGRGG